MFRKPEQGQALVLTAVALVVLLGALGLAIDMGVLRYDKRLQQTAADAAAIAGATNLYNTSDITSTGAGGPGVVSGAIAAAKANGFADTGTYNSGGNLNANSVGYVQVTVNNPPAWGPHSGDGHYVEVYVSGVQPTYFAKIFGVESVTVVARAVASAPTGYNLGDNCLITIQPPSASIEGVNLSGDATLNAPTCGILDNGDFNTKGNSLIVNAGTFQVSGNWVNKGAKLGDITCGPSQASSGCPQYPIPTFSDPLSEYFNSSNAPSLGTPLNTVTIQGSGNTGGCDGTNGCSYGNGTYTVIPGSYCSITIKGAPSDTVVFQSGVYVFGGSGCAGLQIPGNSTITGTGVTFYFSGSSTINVTGTPTMELTAPGGTGATSIPPAGGPYPGLLMWQDARDTSTAKPNGPQLGGNDGSYYDGILYFPSDELTFYGNATSCTGTDCKTGYGLAYVVTGSIALSGTPQVNIYGAASLPTGVHTNAVPTLVE